LSYPTADAAAAAFYRAFASGDAAAMDALWLDDDAACCVHPAREPVLGHGAIMASWLEILEEAGSFDISFQPDVRLGDGDLVVDVGTERLTTDSGQVALLSVTNAYLRTPDGWRMVLHHAAPIQHAGTPADAAVH
jgi:ketosteroid isomerase-like protein